MIETMCIPSKTFNYNSTKVVFEQKKELEKIITL